VLVKKKSGDIRMCVDYRAINKLTYRDNYPLPLIEDCLLYPEGKKYFTLLDLKSAFNQVSVHPNSIEITSFVTPIGQYEYMKMPYGLKNAPAVFQRYIHEIFRDMIDRGDIVIYMDDILVAGSTLDDHNRLLRDVLEICCRRGLQLNLSKCQFAFETLIFLGHRITADGISMTDSRITAIKEYPLPTDHKKLLSCLCLFNYFRRFIKDYSLLAAPLHAAMKTKTLSIDDDFRKAFEILRRKLTEAPVLAIYNPERETELHTDASSKGYGGCLMQKHDGRFHPVAYFSRRTTADESRYHSFELETLAVIRALEHFQIYLQGIHFTIVTDCNSLTLTVAKKQLNRRISRWVLELEGYDYSITHRSGVSMPHVDALSRCEPISLVTAMKGKGEETEDTDCEFLSAIDPAEVEERLVLAQSRDADIVRIRDRLESSDDKKFKLINGLVYRISKLKELLYVPREMEENVIRMAHELMGHQGVEKTEDQVRRSYWMPKMKDRIKTHINNCIPCLLHSSPVRLQERSLHMIPKKPIPFDTLHIDNFGPLPAVHSKRKHILVVIDGFTKFVKLYPIISTSTREVTAALQKYFDYYSRPRRIISDRGTCFTSNEFKEFAVKRNIDHICVATAAPQANGQVERTNRVLKAMLGKLTEPTQHADWVKLLGHAEFAINNSTHSTTGETPSDLLFGVRQRGPVVDGLGELLEGEKTLDRDLIQIRSEAADCILKSQNYTTERHTSRQKSIRSFIPGDYVVIRNVDNTPGCNKKFLPTFKGPYVVHKSLGNDRYVIRDVENCQRAQIPYDGVIDASRMKKWVDADLISDHSPFDSHPHRGMKPPKTDANAETDETLEAADGPQGRSTNLGADESNKLIVEDDTPEALEEPEVETHRRLLRPLPHRRERSRIPEETLGRVYYCQIDRVVRNS
jgi:hypothetical protein